MRQVHGGPLAGLASAIALLAVLAATVGLGPSAWVAGLVCAGVTWGLLEEALTYSGLPRLGPANAVTHVRASLAAVLAALVVSSWHGSVPVPLVVGLAAIALATDAVDGRVARRTGWVSALGARFDMESDALLILVLSWYVAPRLGWWVLVIGLARYLLLAAGLVRPWLRGETPPRSWGKVVAAYQGLALTIAASGLLPATWSRLLLLTGLALLAESFGRQVWTLRRLRHAYVGTPAPPSRTVDVLAVTLVWTALMLPARPDLLALSSLLGIPLELLAFAALALVLPVAARRVVAATAGLALGVLVLLKVADLGFYSSLDRPFDPLSDPSYAGAGLGVLRDSLGPTVAAATVALGAVAVVAIVGLALWATLRIGRAVRAAPRVSVSAVGALALVWAVGAGTGAAVRAGVPLAAAPGAGLVRAQVGQIRGDLRDREIFDRARAHDRFASAPAGRLLTGLRGKDVLLVFVESYGRVATQGSWFAPQVDASLASDTRRLGGLGFSARSGYLTSPTFGGISWLAHSTLQTGLWIDSQQRYDDVVHSDRFTLSDAFHRAGWRTVGDVPSNPSGWPEGQSFYHYDRLYDGSDVGYRGPRFSYAAMPDQYTLAAFDRNELRGPHRRPVMAEIDLVSSHTPWTPLPHLLPWHSLGDGSVFDGMQASHATLGTLLGGRSETQRDYARSVVYSLASLVSFVRHAHDRKLVMVVLGDHQPSTLVSGTGVSHDVPISVVAHDPRVLGRIAGWHWTPGLLPDPASQAITMNRFRDRFLTAYGPRRGAR